MMGGLILLQIAKAAKALRKKQERPRNERKTAS